MLKLILFVLPLGLDTLGVAAALGVRGLSKRLRTRVSLLMSAFDMAMPVAGLLLGRAFGHLVGGGADSVAIGVLALLGVWMLVHEEEDEDEKVAQFAGHVHSLALRFYRDWERVAGECVAILRWAPAG